MEILLTRAIEALLLPPGGPLLLALAGLSLWPRARRLGLGLLGSGLGLLTLFSLPLVATALLASLEQTPALAAETLADTPAGAIVVLSGGRNPDAPEYGADTLGAGTLERLRYAAFVHRRSGLPVLVTGGAPLGQQAPMARLMAEALVEDYGIHGAWQETGSTTTAENARYSARLLREKGVKTILLVTHAWHMPRSAAVFRQAGLEVIPAPTAFSRTSAEAPLLHQLLPSGHALADSQTALHEYLGRLWYAIRH